jgi:hypothetical protein
MFCEIYVLILCSLKSLIILFAKNCLLFYAELIIQFYDFETTSSFKFYSQFLEYFLTYSAIPPVFFATVHAFLHL